MHSLLSPTWQHKNGRNIDRQEWCNRNWDGTIWKLRHTNYGAQCRAGRQFGKPGPYEGGEGGKEYRNVANRERR